MRTLILDSMRNLILDTDPQVDLKVHNQRGYRKQV
jgi:hypothetical protein